MKYVSDSNLATFFNKLKNIFANKTDVDAKMENPMTAAGDLIVGGTNGTPTRLPLGTAGQVPKVNAAGTGLEYGDAGGGHLYRHCLYIDSYASKCFANIITDSPTAFTLPTLKSYLYDCGYINSVQKFASASGFYDADNLIVGICTSTDKTDLYLVTSQPNHSIATLNSQASSMVDTIYQIM